VRSLVARVHREGAEHVDEHDVIAASACAFIKPGISSLWAFTVAVFESVVVGMTVAMTTKSFGSAALILNGESAEPTGPSRFRDERASPRGARITNYQFII
jgi:hypothetical protein